MFEKAVVLALMIEAFVETLKPIWDAEKREGTDAKKALKTKLIVLGISVTFTVLVGIDLFEIVGLEILAWANVNPTIGLVIGAVLSGVVLSRGANFAHDLLFKKIAGKNG